jgi:hypothetical protein
MDLLRTFTTYNGKSTGKQNGESHQKEPCNSLQVLQLTAIFVRGSI